MKHAASDARSRIRWLWIIVSIAAGVMATPLHAQLVPYTPDTNTVYLIHFEDSVGSTSPVNTGSGSVNLYAENAGSDWNNAPVTDVIDGSSSYSGFGNAANLYPSGQARGLGFDASGNGDFNDEEDASGLLLGNFMGADIAFTFEALVKPDEAQNAMSHHYEIFSGDTSAATRGFQFRIKSDGTLEYNGIDWGGGNHFGTIAFNAGEWYHVALTYTEAGQSAGNGLYTMYWTALGSGASEASVSLSWVGTVLDPSQDSPFMIGNEARDSGDEPFRGLMDEVRISSVARTADGFLFSIVDTDADGLPDDWEQQIVDADLGDGIMNVVDVLPGDNFDGDSFTNQQEFDQGSDPTVFTDPDDIDADGLSDAWETTYFPSIWSYNGSDDPDGDGLTNEEEETNGTDPSVFNNPADSDSDGLPDAWERLIIDAAGGDGIMTILDVHPEDDFDGDGFTNNEEYLAGTDATDSASVPGDSDADGLSDEWELENFGSLAYAGSDDPDGDSDDNATEQGGGTDPNDPLDYPGAPVDPAKPTGQMVDLLAHPGLTTIPDTQPEFGWVFHPVARGETQNAYQIIVAFSALGAGAGTGDVWDSGKVDAPDSVDVECGISLARGSNYYWRVRTWGDTDIASAWSGIQGFTIEPTYPQVGARSIYKASANDGTGYNWAGRYQSAFDTVVTPASIVDKGGGDYFIDFGKDGFGYMTLRLNGSFAGQSMTVKFSEHATGNSVVDAGGSTTFTSKSISLQNGDVVYEIHTPDVSGGSINVDGWAGGVVTPFRYVELAGCPAGISAADIRHYVLSVPFDEGASSFESSDAVLNAVFELCKYSMKATSFASVYVDGDRERKPYEADAYINQLSHYSIDREFTTARYSYEYLLDHSTWPTEWKFHFPLMAWADYMYTGNKEALAANYAAILGHVDQYSSNERGDGLLDYGSGNNIVDWPSGERDGFVFTSLNNVVNAFYFKSWCILADIATELGYVADAADFAIQAAQMETSFNNVFWNGSQYQDGESATHVSAHANFFPMALGLVPSNRVESVMDFLKTKQMPCSVYGAQYLLEALFEGGADDHAIGLMKDNSTSYDRHWWNMIDKGSTISMEAWDNSYKSNQDWNHAWGAAPANIVPRYVLGVKPLTPGFGVAEIKPQLGTGDGTNGLTYVSGTVPTIRGPVVIEATNSPSLFRLRIEVPGNMIASVSIPTKGFGIPVVLYDGIIVDAPVADGRLVIDNVPGGKHAIWLSSTSTPDVETMKNNWKVAMFGNDLSNADDGLDPDGDGWTTGEEFYTNTDPLDAADAWACTMQLNTPSGPFESVMDGKAGRRYVLERTPSLMPVSWADVDETNLNGQAYVWLSDTNPIMSNAFYRTRVELP